MTVTRSEIPGSPGAGIHVKDSTQATVLDNDCHHNSTGIRVEAAWTNIANNTCHRPMGDGSGDDEWQLVPTDSGYYQVVNASSGLVMAVEGAVTSRGARVVHATYSFVNHLSGLYLDVRHRSRQKGAGLIRWVTRRSCESSGSRWLPTPRQAMTSAEQ